MNKLELNGTLNIAKGKLQQKCAQLANDDVEYREGKRTELTGLIQKEAAQPKPKTEPAISECSCCHSGD